MATDKEWVLSASDAFAQSKKNWDPVSTADKINFDLTLRRLMAGVEAAAARGDRQLCFVTPSLIIDGSSVDPVKLARQLAAKLESLDFAVSRHGKALYIDWDLDLREAETRCSREAREEAKQVNSGRRGRPVRTLSPPRAGQMRRGGGAARGRRGARRGEIDIN